MPFWKCYYHVVWTTHNRLPILTPSVEEIVIDVIKRKSAAMECSILAINGVPDHLHVAINIPPKVAVAEWVRSVKGLSTHEVNGMYPNLETSFRWQGGYGVLTFGAKHLPLVESYIRLQKEHHANNQVDTYLERTED